MGLTLPRIEPGRPPARRSRFWTLIGWCSSRRWHDGFCLSGWGRRGGYVVVYRRGTRFRWPASNACGKITRGGTWCRRHWFWQIWSSKLCRFGVVDVDCALQPTVFVNYLILVGYAADSIGSFPSGRQLGGSLRRGGECEDQTANLVGIGDGCGWGRRHLLVGELESLLDGLNVTRGCLRRQERGWHQRRGLGGRLVSVLLRSSRLRTYGVRVAWR